MKQSDPMARFEDWYQKAQECGLKEPTSMSLATVDSQNRPSCRILLLKGHSSAGFVFYTNHNSSKGQDLKNNPWAALCFHWMPLGRQVRIRGVVEPVTAEEAQAYWDSRSRQSQIGAWASPQSETLASRKLLLDGFAQLTEKFRGQEVPRPRHWSGYILKPEVMEFWEQGEHRLHFREEFTRSPAGWVSRLLYP